MCVQLCVLLCLFVWRLGHIGALAQAQGIGVQPHSDLVPVRRGLGGSTCHDAYIAAGGALLSGPPPKIGSDF